MAEGLLRLKDRLKGGVASLLASLKTPAVNTLEEEASVVHLQVGLQLWPNVARDLRTELWLSCLHRAGPTVSRNDLVDQFGQYVAMPISDEAANDIDKDLRRTFPNTKRFKAEEGQASLRKVLRAYAAYDPDVSYCQGMNFVAGLLLMYMPTEGHAFAALVMLMEESGLRRFYGKTMALLQVQLWQLSKLMPTSLNKHLEACGVVPVYYASGWLMTAFSCDFPISFAARIIDAMMSDRCDFALLKVAATLLEHCERRLLSLHHLEDILTYLKTEVPAWDEASLHAVLTSAFSKPWTPRQLRILHSTEGVETVAQAMGRVAGKNDANSMSSSLRRRSIDASHNLDTLDTEDLVIISSTTAESSSRGGLAGSLLDSLSQRNSIAEGSGVDPFPELQSSLTLPGQGDIIGAGDGVDGETTRRDPTFLAISCPISGIPLLRPPPSYTSPGWLTPAGEGAGGQSAPVSPVGARNASSHFAATLAQLLPGGASIDPGDMQEEEEDDDDQDEEDEDAEYEGGEESQQVHLQLQQEALDRALWSGEGRGWTATDHHIHQPSYEGSSSSVFPTSDAATALAYAAAAGDILSGVAACRSSSNPTSSQHQPPSPLHTRAHSQNLAGHSRQHSLQPTSASGKAVAAWVLPSTPSTTLQEFQRLYGHRLVQSQEQHQHLHNEHSEDHHSEPELLHADRSQAPASIPTTASDRSSGVDISPFSTATTSESRPSPPVNLATLAASPTAMYSLPVPACSHHEDDLGVHSSSFGSSANLGPDPFVSVSSPLRASFERGSLEERAEYCCVPAMFDLAGAASGCSNGGKEEVSTAAQESYSQPSLSGQSQSPQADLSSPAAPDMQAPKSPLQQQPQTQQLSQEPQEHQGLHPILQSPQQQLRTSQTFSTSQFHAQQHNKSSSEDWGEFAAAGQLQNRSSPGLDQLPASNITGTSRFAAREASCTSPQHSRSLSRSVPGSFAASPERLGSPGVDAELLAAVAACIMNPHADGSGTLTMASSSAVDAASHAQGTFLENGGATDSQDRTWSASSLPASLLQPRPAAKLYSAASMPEKTAMACIATTVAGDILRAMGVLDFSNVSVPYDLRTKLADSTYADSAGKGHHALITPFTSPSRTAPPIPQPPPASPVDIYPSGYPSPMNTTGRAISPCRQLSEEYVFVDVANFANSTPNSLGRMGSGDMVTRTQLCSGYDVFAERAEVSRGIMRGWAGEAGEQSASLLDSGNARGGAEDLHRQCADGGGSSSAAETNRESGMADLGTHHLGEEIEAVQMQVSQPVTCYVDGIPMFDPRSLLRPEDRQSSVLLGACAAAAVAAADDEAEAGAASAAAAEAEIRIHADGSGCGGSPPSDELETRCSIPLSHHLLAAALGSGSSGMLEPGSWTAPLSQSHDSYQQPHAAQNSLRNSHDSCRDSRNSSSGGAVDDWIRHDERLSNNNNCPHPTHNNLHHSESTRYCAAPTLIAHSAGGATNNAGSGSSIPLASWQSASGALSPSPSGEASACTPSVVLFDYHHTTTSFGSTPQGSRQWVTATPEPEDEEESGESSSKRLQHDITSQHGFSVRPLTVAGPVTASEFQLPGLDELVQQQLA